MRLQAVSEPTEAKRGRRNKPGALTMPERVRKFRDKKKLQRLSNIAILDMETDPFDHETEAPVYPFLAVLYSDNFAPVIIWDESPKRLATRVCEAIEALPEAYTIYAHNGGRFDYMFLVHQLRGKVSFKGRGIMCANIGRHQLRDSFHIIPERLANWQKDDFDYRKNTKGRRQKFRDEIIAYCINDCKYLLDIVKTFTGEFGLRLSIGQAAMFELKKHYQVKKFSDNWDAYVRQFYFGGRVQCLTGRAHLAGDYKLYDVNSMYPSVMASFKHPIGDLFDYKIRPGKPNRNTVFLDITCDNDNALISRDENGATVATQRHGRFFTTIHEFRIAEKYGLIKNVVFNYCLDCTLQTDFSKFILPLYDKRQQVKRALKQATIGSSIYNDLKKDDIFLKLLLNNAYGKFAQNPRNYKEHWLTNPGEEPPPRWFKSIHRLPEGERGIYLRPAFECSDYDIWEKPNPGFHFNNVGTAASITGAARAMLLEALQCAESPVYCDTDSIICKALHGVKIDGTELGAWDLEDEFSEIIINGKKLYSCRYKQPKMGADGQLIYDKVRSKGVSGVTWADMLALYDGAELAKPNKAPTLNRYSEQFYMSRSITATAPLFAEKEMRPC